MGITWVSQVPHAPDVHLILFIQLGQWIQFYYPL